MAKYKKRGSKISLDEFRAWLSGVEEMQDEGWFPSDSQWATIRKKMDLIEEQEVEVPVQQAHQPYQQPQAHQPYMPQHGPVHPVQEASGAPAAPRVQSLQPSGDSPGSLKTPDIDSSEGYTSSFE